MLLVTSFVTLVYGEVTAAESNQPIRSGGSSNGDDCIKQPSTDRQLPSVVFIKDIN